MDWALLLEWFLKSLVLIFGLLGGFAYTTYYERRWIARLQVRVGPNRVGPLGLLQPIADAAKLIFKEELTPAKVYKTVFFLSPLLTMVPSLVIAAVIPLGTSFTLGGRTIHMYLANINVGALYLMSVASIAVYGIVLAGWSSNNKYAMLGGLRSTAQMISYELTLGLMFVAAILLGNSMSMVDIVEGQRDMWFGAIQPVGFVLFFIATLAEVNRSPFDMPEAEQELTAGYHTEYSGMKFALFFMAEYQKMIVVSMIGATLFLGGYRELWFLKDTFLSVDRAWFLGPFYLVAKVFLLLGLMIWIRAAWPRIRYDRLMSLGWKVLVPLSLAVIFLTAAGILIESSWFILISSLLAAAVAVAFIQRALRRKAYEFA
ncbi:MAG: NADH-quinone oxidoreductase subunit H [Anaerolineales bacterium]|nr:NADH-quinone oxidoreductase subunit H [Anaerolineales bacterium]